MREISRAIQRIDIPAVLTLKPAPSPLFTVNPMGRKRLLQPRNDQLFAGAVRLRHQIHIALVLRLHALRVKLTQQRTGLPRNPLRNMRKLKLRHHSHAPPLKTSTPQALSKPYLSPGSVTSVSIGVKPLSVPIRIYPRWPSPYHRASA